MFANQPVVRQILYPNKDSSRSFGINFHANLYKGCTFGCIYCEFRNTCSATENFDEITYKPNTIEILTKELSGKPKHSIVSLGSLTDPYNPIESTALLTHQSLELLDQNQLGVAISTKSDLILRDVDLLKRIQSHSPAVVLISITTLNDMVASKLEPGAPKTTDRFKLVSKLTQEGILVGIKMIPIIPFINDSEENILGIIRSAKNAGAKFVYPAFGITLRDKQRNHFFDMIEKEFPGLKNVYMDTFGSKFSCISPASPKLKKAFVIECKKQKLLYGMKEIVQLIRPDKNVQMKLF
jgi:DNA repair photolyase